MKTEERERERRRGEREREGKESVGRRRQGRAERKSGLDYRKGRDRLPDTAEA